MGQICYIFGGDLQKQTFNGVDLDRNPRNQKGQLSKFHLPARRKFPKTQPCTLAPERSSLSELVASSSPRVRSFFSSHTELPVSVVRQRSCLSRSWWCQWRRWWWTSTWAPEDLCTVSPLLFSLFLPSCSNTITHLLGCHTSRRCSY